MLRSVIQVVLFRPLWYNFAYGALAQLIERSIRIAEVAGLIPARSTTFLDMDKKITPAGVIFNWLDYFFSEPPIILSNGTHGKMAAMTAKAIIRKRPTPAPAEAYLAR